jgi:hypothetical protein
MARALLAVAAAGALVAALPTAADAVAADGALRSALVWQAYGLVVFAGLFALLAWRPRGYRGVWELAILNKVALTVTALFTGDGAVLAADGALSVLLVAAYVLARGWSRG